MLFLEEPVDARVGAAVSLSAAEEHHAARVLRLSTGDEVEARDGRGGCYRLRVARAERRALELVLCELPRFDPEPGAVGATLPRIEIAVAWPKDTRGEDMLARLVQLGAAAIWPLEAQHTGAGRRADRRDRLERILVENLKQCGRAWLPELAEPRGLGAVLEAWRGRAEQPPIVLDPRAVEPLDRVLAADLASPWIGLLVGPEGGWAAPESALLDTVGARRARLGPHVLRIETAAEAACALASCLLERR